MRMLQERNISELELRPLTARSIVLSTLLGVHPPALSARQLVRSAALFDVSEGTTRVALSRMVADGDLVAAGGLYALSDRLVQRQQRQDASRTPRRRRWRGDWEIIVVRSKRRTAAERVRTRTTMHELRLSELREGVWTRPDNLLRDVPQWLAQRCRVFAGRPNDPAELVTSLWDLDGWTTYARRLSTAMRSTKNLATTCMVAAAVLRHLLADPLLPSELLPKGWPGERLRQDYDRLEASWRGELDAYLDRTS